MRIFINVFGLLLMMSAGEVWASDGQISAFSSQFVVLAENAVRTMTDSMANVLFYPMFKGVMGFSGIPFLILWLIVGSVFFTVRLGFINFRLFGHAVSVIRGKYSKKSDKGEVSHFQALAAAVSATVGLGNIAGVAVAVSIGGPGAIAWMVFAGFLGMSSKFAEVTMGQKYRQFDKEGRISGGAFHYLELGLKEKGMKKFGKFLAIVFAVACLGGSIGGGNMFQSHEAVAVLKGTFGVLQTFDQVIALILAVTVGIVLIGGIRRIAKVAEKIVPLMAFFYLAGCVTILCSHSDKIVDSLWLIGTDAFSGAAVGGGIIGAIIAGFKRAAFSSEAGLGSAPIAHACARTNEPVREGCVALLEPFIDTVVICFMTGLVLVVTGVYDGDAKGVLMTSAAFATVGQGFVVVLSIAVVLFAYSTMITWSYYGVKAWNYLFGGKHVGIYYIIFCVATFVGGVIEELDVVINFSDMLLLSMAIPNLIGLYILSGDISKDVGVYMKKLKAGKFG